MDSHSRTWPANQTKRVAEHNLPKEPSEQDYETWFVFALVWSFGSALFHDGATDHKAEFSKWFINDFIELLEHIKPSDPVWKAVGVFALPGKPILVELLEGSTACNGSDALQVGCHSDDLRGLQVWHRWPKIDSSMSLVDLQKVGYLEI